MRRTLLCSILAGLHMPEMISLRLRFLVSFLYSNSFLYKLVMEQMFLMNGLINVSGRT